MSEQNYDPNSHLDIYPKLDDGQNQQRSLNQTPGQGPHITVNPSVPESPAQEPPLSNHPVENEEVLKTISKWNWGAFLLGFIWGIPNKVWWSLVDAIPLLMQLAFIFCMIFGYYSIAAMLSISVYLFTVPQIIVRVILGITGSKSAWKHRKFASLEQFRAVQKKWAWAGLIYFIVVAISTITVIVYALFSFNNELKKSGTNVGEMFSEAAFDDSVQKLGFGALAYQSVQGQPAKSMSEIFSSANYKVILSLDGLNKVPETSSGDKIKYCYSKDSLFFVYKDDKGNLTKFDPKENSHDTYNVENNMASATCVDY